MPVLPDSAGADAKYIENSSGGSLTWKHNVNTLLDMDTVVGYVAVLYACHGAPHGSFTATFGGTPMVQVENGLVDTNTAMALFQLGTPAGEAAVTPGQNTVVVSFTGMPTSLITQNFEAVSVTYSGVESVGTILVATPAAGSANTITVADGDAPVGAYRVVTFHGVGLGRDFKSYNLTRRAISPGLIGGARLLVGDAQGAASVTGTATMTSSTGNWLAFAVPLAPAPVSGSGTAPAFGFGEPSGRGGLYRVSTPPDWRMWRVANGTSEQSITEGTIRTPPDATVAPNVGPAFSKQFTQSPRAVLDYGVICDMKLAPGDKLVDAVFTESTGVLTILSSDVDKETGQFAVVWLEGGAIPNTYSIDCHTTSLEGRQDDYTFTLVIEPT